MTAAVLGRPGRDRIERWVQRHLVQGLFCPPSRRVIIPVNPSDRAPRHRSKMLCLAPIARNVCNSGPAPASQSVLFLLDLPVTRLGNRALPHDGTRLGLQIDRYTAVHDVGVELNPLLVEGQVHGGIAQAAGLALMENIAYDADSGRCCPARSWITPPACR
jgi:hypothetical protein